MQTVVFPDAESVITSYLRNQITPYIGDTIHVGTDVPNPRPEEFIRLIRTGGVVQTQVSDGPQITLESWAMNEDRAYEIAKYARALVSRLQNDVWNGTTFYRMQEFSGPNSNPDDDSEMARYTWTFIIGMRGIPFT